jgi:hypothetical protein
MSEPRSLLIICLALIAMQAPLCAQSTESSHAVATSPAATTNTQSVDLQQKLDAISSALVTTHQQLEQSQKEIEQLREQLALIKKQLASAQPDLVQPSNPVNGADTAKATAAAIEEVQEQQQTLEAQVKLHEQTKIEGESKYPVRVTGLILFNSFINRGIVDDIDLPEAALAPSNETGNGSAGASFRQTILGLEGFGPRIAGAHTSADVNIDFFGGLAYSSSSTSAGIVRMRTASINLNWSNDSIQVGMVTPLISPLSPTSYATVAEPSMAGAGNLWTWSPQLKYAHQFSIQSGRQIQLELGLWDPPAAGYSTSVTVRAPSPGEQSKQPAYESRISYGAPSDNSYGPSLEDHSFHVGLSGYYSRQSYPYGNSLDSWAFTTDFRIPLTHLFEVSGEGYRGRALGGLGGGVYKDVLYGTSPITHLASYRGLNAIGGWTQLKTRLGQSLEANAVIGLDDGFAGDFHTLIYPTTATEIQLRARNEMVVGNIIFRPKTYLILSPEYRRIWTWPIYGLANTANIFTLSAGYQF